MMSKQITGYIQVKHLQNVSDMQENFTLRNEFRSVYLMNYECPEKKQGFVELCCKACRRCVINIMKQLGE